MNQGLRKVYGLPRSQLISEPVRHGFDICCLAMALAVMISGCDRRSSGADGEATLPELNRIVSVLTMKNHVAPNDVSQLTNFLNLEGKSLPKPPPGKKLVIDPISHLVVFTDQ
jgi:hypothetical protein